MRKNIQNKNRIIIVGGGLNGLGCAKRLRENGVPFKLITENIGGRVKTSPDGEVNYGAYFITDDYHNIMPYVEKVNLVHFAKAHFHQGENHYHAYSFRLLKHIPAGIRLLIELFRFRNHARKARKLALNVSYRNLIEADPYLKKYYHQKAGVFIKKRGLEKLTKEYLEQFLWAASFTDPRKMSTAMFLGILLTVIVPSYSFKFHFEKLIKPFRRFIIYDSVVKITRLDAEASLRDSASRRRRSNLSITEQKNDKFLLKTKSGKTYRCDILVIATPMNVTNGLIKPQKTKKGINVNYYHIRGKIKKKYDTSWYNFFPIEEQTALSREADGTYLYFYGGKDNIAKYFDSWEMIAKDKWRPAFLFLGDEYINENPEPNLFLANDHNVAGTEDAFINGHYIASLVLRSLSYRNLK